MVHEDFKNNLKSLNLKLTQFSDLVELPYSTVCKFGKDNPVPKWVNPFLKLYEENLQIKDLKNKIKEFASEL